MRGALLCCLLKKQGLHNWIQIYNEEKRGKLDYMGYIFPRKRGYADTPAEDEQLITVQVRRNSHVKQRYTGAAI